VRLAIRQDRLREDLDLTCHSIVKIGVLRIEQGIPDHPIVVEIGVRRIEPDILHLPEAELQGFNVYMLTTIP
jgi:hypothetical protein